MMPEIKTPQVTILPDGRMDTSNAATYSGLSVKTLATLRCNGTGPRYVKRGRVFYFKDDFDHWLQSGRVSSTAQASIVAHQRHQK